MAEIVFANGSAITWTENSASFFDCLCCSDFQRTFVADDDEVDDGEAQGSE